MQRSQKFVHPRTILLPTYFFLCLLFSFQVLSQTVDGDRRQYVDVAKRVIEAGLDSGQAYEFLRGITQFGPRLAGSPQSIKAITWSTRTMEALGFENVRLQPLMAPHWERGPVEEGAIVNSPSVGTKTLSICALGGSIPTPSAGITAEVIEVKSFDELRTRAEEARGKIVFFNRPMDPKKINTFEAYGGAVSQRTAGAIEAAKAGAVAAIVRSMTLALDDIPHTGQMNYLDTIPKIPGAAISTVGANLLSELIKKEKIVRMRLKLTCRTLSDVETANVIGELVGTEKPDEIISVGGHIDSWDKGDGAHDDGSGCAQAIEAVRLLKQLGLRPKRTIRVVLWMNEENGLRGGQTYADSVRPNELHIAAIEADAGGAVPRGFGVGADSATVEKVARWSYLLDPIDAGRISRGGGGADIGPLMRRGVPGIGMRVDAHRYFDYHHSDKDTIDKVHPRELQLGAIAIAILAYTLAMEGI